MDELQLLRKLGSIQDGSYYQHRSKKPPLDEVNRDFAAAYKDLKRKIKGRYTLTAQEWKPISEEPDELQEIVVCWPDGEWLKALYYDGEYCFEVNEGKAMVQKIGFTHWRPIQPPKKD